MSFQANNISRRSLRVAILSAVKFWKLISVLIQSGRNKKNTCKKCKCFFNVRVTGVEPAASWTPFKCPENSNINAKSIQKRYVAIIQIFTVLQRVLYHILFQQSIPYIWIIGLKSYEYLIHWKTKLISFIINLKLPTPQIAPNPDKN